MHGTRLVERTEGLQCPDCLIEAKESSLRDELSRQITEAAHLENHRTLENESIFDDPSTRYNSFATFVTTTGEEEQALESARMVAEEVKQHFYTNTPPVNVWLVGGAGAGKTHLAMSILKDVNNSGDKQLRCAFVSVPKLFSLIKDTFDDASERDRRYYIDLCSTVDVLALDDLGAEVGADGTGQRASNFVHQVINEIASARQGKVTILTTNHSSKSLVDTYDQRIVSRLAKNHRTIILKDITDKRLHGLGF